MSGTIASESVEDQTPGPTMRLERIEGPECAEIRVRAGQVLGRSDGAHLRLDHDGVSRKHAVFTVDAAGWSVTDLGSRHGVRLNDIRIAAEKPTRIVDGQAITIGPWVFVARIGNGGGVERVVRPEPAQRGDTLATRPTIFLRLRDDDPRLRELSWQEFHDRYSAVILAYGRRSGLDANEASDVLQDVLLGFFRVAPTFQYDPEKGRFRGYLRRAVGNAIRRRHRRPEPGGLPDDPVDDRTHHDDPWETAWAEQVLSRAIAEAVARVDERTAEAFELYARRGVPAEEVASRLVVSVNVIHQAKSRVMRLVREIAARIRHDEG